MKKGFTRTQIMEAILAVAIAVVIIYATAQFTGFTKYKTDSETCRDSLLAMQSSIIHVGVDIKGSSWRPKCNKERITINSDNGLKIKKEIAEAMRRCWEKVGYGNLRPFSAKLFNSKYYCILCSEISFADKVKKKIPAVYNINLFLQNHKPSLSDESYWDTFLKGKYCFEDSLFNLKDLEKINTSKKYDLLWIFAKCGTGVPGCRERQIMRLIPEEMINEVPEDEPCAELYQYYKK